VTTGFLRCPHCASAVRPGAQWCSLCHSDLRSDAERAAAAPVAVAPSSEPEPERVPDLELQLATSAALGTAPTAAEAESSAPSGRHARRALAAPGTRPTAPLGDGLTATAGDAEGQVDPLAQVDVEGMLAALASDSSALTGVAGRFSSKANVAMFAFGGAALLTVLGLAAMFILGSLLR